MLPPLSQPKSNKLIKVVGISILRIYLIRFFGETKIQCKNDRNKTVGFIFLLLFIDLSFLRSIHFFSCQ